MSKERTALVIITTLVVIIVIFISIKAISYFTLKNNCIKNNTTSQNGYSFYFNFSPDASQTEIDRFVTKTKMMAGIQNVDVETNDERLQEFRNEQANDPEVLKELNEIGTNPFPPSITVQSSIKDMDTFLRLEDNILAEAEKLGLRVTYHNDGKLKYLQKQLAKVRGASFFKDFFYYIFSINEKSFFVENYSPICNPDFLRNLPN